MKTIDTTELLKQKDNVIKVIITFASFWLHDLKYCYHCQDLGDELQLYRLELTQKETKLNESDSRCRELERENQDILQRLMDIKTEQATKLNDVNTFVERSIDLAKDRNSI